MSRHRLTSRILVVDFDDRVSLMLTKGSVPAEQTRWITPGGGVDTGETHHAAACRELLEETGYVIDELGSPVWLSDFAVDYVGGDHDPGHAEFFLLRTDTFTPSTAGFTDDEKVDILESRWWSLAQLEATDEAYEPAELPVLLARFTTPHSGTDAA